MKIKTDSSKQSGRRVFGFFLPACVALCLPALFAADPCPPQPSVLALTSDPLLKEVIHSRTAQHRVEVAADGISPSSREWLEGKRKGWAIEFQRGGGNLIMSGVVMKDHKMVDAGLRLFEWGFSRQNPSDGDFPDSGDAFHSTSVFASEVARSLLVLTEKQAEFAEVMPRVKALIPKLNAAAHWFLRPGVLEPGKQKDQLFTHRKWILAFALGGTSKLSGDAELARAAVTFAEEGLALQQEDGRNPERGGYDVSYQMVDAFQCSYYYTTLEPATSAELMARIRRMLEKTCQWEMRRLLPNGEIDVTGSTRMLIEHGHNGQLKHTNYPEVIQAFVHTALITGKPEYAEVAKRIARGQGWLGTAAGGSGSK